MYWRPKLKNKIYAQGDKLKNKAATSGDKAKNKDPASGDKPTKNRKVHKRDMLKIILNHGDIMIMHGAKIQELYEVSQCCFCNLEIR
jgi:hypothetical protein